jgi:hypothetical protein
MFLNPPNDPKFSYLFYTNETRSKHNELTFLQETIDDVYIFHKQDRNIMSHVLKISI